MSITRSNTYVVFDSLDEWEITLQFLNSLTTLVLRETIP